jgi:hypothetical protein
MKIGEIGGDQFHQFLKNQPIKFEIKKFKKKSRVYFKIFVKTE